MASRVISDNNMTFFEENLSEMEATIFNLKLLINFVGGETDNFTNNVGVLFCNINDQLEQYNDNYKLLYDAVREQYEINRT